MGQQASDYDGPAGDREAIITDPQQFIECLGVTGAEIGTSMHPQTSLVCDSDLDARRLGKQLEALDTNMADWRVDVARSVVTLTHYVGPDPDQLLIDGRTVSWEEAGITIRPIDDHSSGRHHPRGVLLSSRPFRNELPDVIDYLDAAAVMLDQIGVESLAEAA